MFYFRIMVRKKGKKGSHIGIVLSFTIFVSFIFFFYVMVQPVMKYETKQNQVELLKTKIIQEASENLRSFSLMISWSGNNVPACVKLIDFINQANIEGGIRAGNYEEAVDFYIEGNDVYVKTLGNSFVKVYESIEFEGFGSSDDMTGCAELANGPSGYIIGFTKTEERVFETKIIKLIEDYFGNYEEVKENLGIPRGSEFALGFVFYNGTEIGFSYLNGEFTSTGNSNIVPPRTASVFAEEIPIEYIDSDSTKRIGKIKIMIW